MSNLLSPTTGTLSLECRLINASVAATHQRREDRSKRTRLQQDWFKAGHHTDCVLGGPGNNRCRLCLRNRG